VKHVSFDSNVYYNNWCSNTIQRHNGYTAQLCFTTHMV